MKKLALAFAVMFLGISAGTMRADGIGLPVDGTLNFNFSGSTNWFDSAYGFVPAGYGNSNPASHGTVSIGSGTEFGFVNGFDLITANFTGTTLTVADSCVKTGCGTTPFELKFFSPNFLNFSNPVVNFDGSLSYNYVFDASRGGFVYFIDYAGNGTGGTATFNYSSVPEPGTLGLMATGLLGAAGALRRRFVA